MRQKKILEQTRPIQNPRTYGDSPYQVAVIHGGPGAPGEMAPVARELSSIGGVLEPLQMTKVLENQIVELDRQLRQHATFPVTLIGWSWGAWLSYIYAARHPENVKKLILISSGPFEGKYAEGIMATRLKRLSEKDKTQLRSLMESLNDTSIANKDRIFAQVGALISKADSFNPIPHEDEVIACQFDTYNQVWQEADALRKSGELLSMGKKIICPVIAIHGDYDPHPVQGVKEPLQTVLKDFRFILLKNCGHHPWYEKEARTLFYSILKKEIERRRYV